jgi:hypothetical protein
MFIIQPGGPSLGGVVGTSSTAEIAIPPLSNGDNPKWVYICIVVNGGGGQGISFLAGQTGMGVATLVNGIPCPGWSPGIIINVAGNTHYRVIAGAASIRYGLTPLAGINPGG